MNIKLAYVIHLFPHGQTDIVNELKALERWNIDTTIIAFKRRGDLERIRVAFETKFPVTYLEYEGTRPSSFQLFRDHLSACFRHFRGYFKSAFIASRFMGTNFKLAPTVFKELEKIRPNLVYTPWAWSFSGSTMYACLMLAIPYVFAVRGTEIFPPDRNFTYRVKAARKILTVAEGYANILRGMFDVPVHKLKVVRPCLGPTDFLNAVAPARKEITGPLRLLNVATLRPVKRHVDLIEIAKLLRQKGIEFELRICGDGPDGRQIESLIRNSLLTQNVKLLGHVKQEKLIDQYQWCDIYVHTSESEGCVFSVIEAQASSRPVVAYDARGGLRESVIDGKSAVLVPVGDTQNFADQVIELSKNDQLRIKMGSNARKFARERFSSFKRFSTDFVNALLEAL